MDLNQQWLLTDRLCVASPYLIVSTVRQLVIGLNACEVTNFSTNYYSYVSRSIGVHSNPNLFMTVSGLR